MIRSIRLRFFLVVWPLVVAMVIVVGVLFTRWTQVELATYESPPQRPTARTVTPALLDSIAANWPRLLAVGGGTLLEQWSRQTNSANEIVVTTIAGGLIAASNPTVRPSDVTPDSAGMIVVSREAGGARNRQRQRRREQGVPVMSPPGTVLGRVYAIPPLSVASVDNTALVARARKTLWVTIALTSLVAALATYLLAFPVVAQVQRLAGAARDIRAGKYGTRVVVSSTDELGELERGFNQMAGSLEQTEALKRRMISDVAHELRTPLTNVIGLLEAMRDGVRPATTDGLDSTLEEALLLKHLVEELQELSLADAGALHFDFEVVDLRAEVRRAVDASSAAAPVVRLELGESAPLYARVDRRRLAQILRNLLQNAITHTAGVGDVVARLDQDADMVAVQVRDSGIGIPSDELPLIWERFHRVDPSRARATGGMGLGLAVARQLAIAMGGTMSVESVEHVGSTFTVRFPLVTNAPIES